MAMLSHTPRSFTASENTPPSQSDPFWQTTPLTNPEALQGLMSAIKKVLSPPAQKTTRHAPPASAARRLPQCTHMTMNRLYGEHTCQMCGKVPSIGWVYVCRQDDLLGCRHTMANSEILPVVSDTGDYFQAQGKIAKSLGMSRSVISQMRAGEYSFDQIEILLQQRRHVLDVIRRAESPSVQSTPPSPRKSQHKSHLPAESVIASLGATASPAVQLTVSKTLPTSSVSAPVNAPTQSASTTPSKNIKAVKKPTCNFQVCHACRPFLRDRLPMSFEPVLNNEVPAVTEEEITTLPFLDVDVTRNLGLRQPHLVLVPPNDGVGEVFMPQGDGNPEDTPTDWTPTTTTDSRCSSDLLEDAHDPYPCPGAGVCPLYSPTHGCAYDNGFDDRHRAANHGYNPDHDTGQPQPYGHLHHVRGSTFDTPGGTSSTGSSISLPDPETAPLTPPTPTHTGFGHLLLAPMGRTGKALTVCGVASEDKKPRYGIKRARIAGNESSSSLGSEVEVEGGVALTEEAVGTGVPDIATEESYASAEAEQDDDLDEDED